MRTTTARRTLLVVAYLLTTLVVQGGHSHGREGDEPLRAGCADARAGMAGHATPDPGQAHHDCPICQLRAQVPFGFATPTLGRDEAVEHRPALHVPFDLPSVPRRLSSRAPPHA